MRVALIWVGIVLGALLTLAFGYLVWWWAGTGLSYILLGIFVLGLLLTLRKSIIYYRKHGHEPSFKGYRTYLWLGFLYSYELRRIVVAKE